MERRNYSQDVEKVGCPASLCSIIFIFSILAHMLYFFEIWIGNVIDTKRQCSIQILPCWKTRDTSITIGKRLLVFRSKTFIKGSHS